jgi:hypothetical protein
MVRILFGIALAIIVAAGIAGCPAKEEASTTTPPAAEEDQSSAATD